MARSSDHPIQEKATNMKPRTEDDILARTPLSAKLGDKDYSIPLLAVMAQREWRKNLFAELVPILESFNFTVDGKSMASGLTAALLTFPEKLCDLVFAYAPDLPQEEIFKSATEEQIATAFSSIMAVAFPFIPQLGMVTNLLRATAN
jgi:hypothetical protein